MTDFFPVRHHPERISTFNAFLFLELSFSFRTNQLFMCQNIRWSTICYWTGKEVRSITLKLRRNLAITRGFGEMHLGSGVQEAQDVKPYIALPGRIAIIDIRGRLWMRHFRYRIRSKDSTMRGKSRVYLDDPKSRSSVEAYALVLYNTEH